MNPACRPLCVVALTVGLVHACGDAATPRDGMDAGVDAAVADGAQDASSVDAGANPLPVDCQPVLEELLNESVAFGDDRFDVQQRLASSHDGRTFQLAYQGGGCEQGIGVVEIDSSGPLRRAPDLGGGSDAGCSTATHPAVVVHAGSGFRFLWSEQSDGVRRLWERETDSAPTAVAGSETRVAASVMTELGAGVLAAWIAAEDGGRRVVARRLDVAGATVHTVLDVVAREPLQLAAASLPDGALLGWVEHSDTSRGVYLRRLDAQGAPREPAIRLSELASPKTGIDVAMTERGGAVVYNTVAQDANREVRFRQLDGEGRLVQGERRLVARPDQGADPSIAPFGDAGYVVAYRAPPDDEEPLWTIRLMFITPAGDVAGVQTIAHAEPDGGRTAIGINRQGTILIAWIDDSSFEKTTRVARLSLECG